MPTPSPEQMTQLLQAWGQGENAALERARTARPPGTAAPCAALHVRGARRPHPASHRASQRGLPKVAWLPESGLAEPRPFLRHQRAVDAADSGGCGACARVSEARRRRPEDHSGRGIPDRPRQTRQKGYDLVALDDALQALARFDPRKSQVVELRFFGGLARRKRLRCLRCRRTRFCATGGWPRLGWRER